MEEREGGGGDPSSLIGGRGGRWTGSSRPDVRLSKYWDKKRRKRERQAADRHAVCNHAVVMNGGMVGERGRRAKRSIDFPGR